MLVFKSIGQKWLALSLLLCLTGCAGSLHPLYETEADILDPTDFVGVWDNGRMALRTSLHPDDKHRLLIQTLEDPRMGHITPNSPRPPDTGVYLEGRLVKLGQEVFVDVTFQPDYFLLFAPDLPIWTRMLMVQVHSFMKVAIKDGALVLHQLDVQKLEALLAKNPKLMAHKKLTADMDRPQPMWRQRSAKDGPSLLLTAEPAELRRLFGKHTDVWKAPETFQRGTEADFDKRWEKLEQRLLAARERREKEATTTRARDPLFKETATPREQKP